MVDVHCEQLLDEFFDIRNNQCRKKTKTESIIVLLYTDSKKITISSQFFFKAGDKGT